MPHVIRHCKECRYFHFKEGDTFLSLIRIEELISPDKVNKPAGICGLERMRGRSATLQVVSPDYSCGEFEGKSKQCSNGCTCTCKGDK